MQIESFKLLLQRYEPWTNIPLQNIKMTRMLGITNLTFLAQQDSDPKVVSKMIFRKFDKKCEGIFIDRDIQNQVYRKVGILGIGPKIFYEDETFRLQEFIESKVLQQKEMLEKQSLIRVAHKLAIFHSIQIEKPSAQYCKIINFLKQRKFQQIKARVKEFQQQKQTVEKIITLLQADQLDWLIGQLNGQSFVFSHNDLLANNILVRSDGSFCLIDFEYGGYNPQCMDLMNYLTQSRFNYDYPQYPFFKVQKEASEQSTNFLLRAYCYFRQNNVNQFQLKNLIQKGIEFKQGETQLFKRLKEGSRICLLLCNYFWMVWGLNMVKTPGIPLDYIKFSECRRQIYMKHKDSMI